MTSTPDAAVARIRPIDPVDLDVLVAVNDAAAPAVPVTPRAELERLVGLSDLGLVVDDGEPGGFLLALAPGRDYDSENYRWFSARSAAAEDSGFLYVDRIVLAPRLQSRGLGPRLYAAVVDEARERGFDEVLCEVNTRPANPGSLAFHARLGFRELARQETKGGAVEVALLALEISSAV